MNRAKFIFLFISIHTFSIRSQVPISELKKLISTKYANERCYSLKETETFSFKLTKNRFEIIENFRSTLFTNDYRYSKSNAVFYDDYSEVTKVTYAINNSVLPYVKAAYANYEKGDIFHDDLKICAYTMEMEKNKTYDSYYTKTFKNARFFTRVFFHENYPIAEKTIKFEIPDWVNLEIKPVNFEGYSITIIEKPLPKKKSKEITYVINNIASIPSENHAPGISKYLPHLLVFVKSYNKGKYSDNFFANHNDVYKWNKKLANELNNNETELKPILNEIVKNETDSFKMIEKVFYWVQDKVRYIAFEEGIMGYKPATADKVCNLLYGDCKGMANLTKTFLKMLGFDARLTWIGTDDIPYNNDLPTLAVYNHMICAVIYKNKKYFLDATEDYIAINDYAERIQGRPCMVEDGDNYLVEKIPEFNHERNLHSETYSLKIEKDVLKGISENSFSGETKTRFLQGYNETKTVNKDNALNNYIIGENVNISVKNISTSDLNERTLPLKIKFDLELKNSVLKSSNNELLVLLNKDKELQHLYFDSTRVCDYEFNSKYFITSTCNLDIPESYKVKSMPEAINIDNDIFSFKLTYENKNGKVNLNKIIKIKKGEISKSNFDEWNKAIRNVIAFYNSPVILTKI